MPQESKIFWVASDHFNLWIDLVKREMTPRLAVAGQRTGAQTHKADFLQLLIGGRGTKQLPDRAAGVVIR